MQHKGASKKHPEVTTYFAGFSYVNVIKYVLRYEQNQYKLSYAGSTFSPDINFFAYNHSLAEGDNLTQDRIEHELNFINEIVLTDEEIIALAIMETSLIAYPHPQLNPKKSTHLARYARLTPKGAADLYTVANHAYDPHWIELDLLQRHTPTIKSPLRPLINPIGTIKVLNRSATFTSP